MIYPHSYDYDQMGKQESIRGRGGAQLPERDEHGRGGWSLSAELHARRVAQPEVVLQQLHFGLY
jgi:hypothetical protein